MMANQKLLMHAHLRRLVCSCHIEIVGNGKLCIYACMLTQPFNTMTTQTDTSCNHKYNMAFDVQTCRASFISQAIMLVVCTAGLAVPHQSLGLQISHGPISIAVGLAAGVLLGFVCALTPVWSSPWRKTVALLVMGELLAFCGYELPCATLCCVLLHYSMLCCCQSSCAVLCCAVLCCAVLCCAVLCCAVLCCAVLYLLS